MDSKKIAAASIIMASLAAIYFLYVTQLTTVLIRLLLALLVLLASGYAVQYLLNLKKLFGPLYMIGGTAGLSTMDNLSKRYGAFWEFMWQWGLTLGFGLLAYPLTKGRIDRRVFIFGMATLLVMILFVEPYIAVAGQLINLAPIQAAASKAAAASGPNTLAYAVAVITFIAGFSGYIFGALASNALSILWSFVLFVTNPSLGVKGSGLSSTIPGVAPVIPGLDLPLFAGIIALALLLIIHEFSHGILSRKYKVRLKSTGILLFSFIPVGGFVEPDEKAINRLDWRKKTAIFTAGISANMIATFIFLGLTLIFLLVIGPHVFSYGYVVAGTSPGYPANGVLQKGMQVIKWNNQTVTNSTALASATSGDLPNSTVSILTNKGLYKIKAVADPSNASRGLIGVSLDYTTESNGIYGRIAYFLYTVFALSMLLNFLVAIVNLLPLPGLDGWRIYYANLKSERLIKFLGALVIILLIVNFLPWIFYL